MESNFRTVSGRRVPTAEDYKKGKCVCGDPADPKWEGADYKMRSPGPRVDYEWIKLCLTKCFGKHEEFRPQPGSLQFQARVVDICTRSIVLLPPQAEYIALSYVWGGVSQPNVRQTGRLPDNIPHTIEDAFTVAGNIGINLVWVDSLCINQEDSTHKMQQIQQMEYIYENAYATIIVQDGPDANAGIPGVSTPRHHDVQTQTRRTLPNESIETAIWTTRAWTFQEGMLSRRRIVFNRGVVQVVWHDRSWQEGSPWHKHNEWRGTLANPLGQTDQPLEAYSRLFERYVMRRATNQEDFFPAIAGLLRRLEEKFFLAGFCFGLPLSNFREALLWDCSKYNRGSESKLRLPGVFPTWAWAGWLFDVPLYPVLEEEPRLRSQGLIHPYSVHPPLLLDFHPANPPKPWSNAGSYLDVQMFETQAKFGSDPRRAKHFCFENIARIKQIYQDGFAKMPCVNALFSADTHKVSRESRITEASLASRRCEPALQVTGLIIDLPCSPSEENAYAHQFVWPQFRGCEFRRSGGDDSIWEADRVGSRDFLWLSTHFDEERFLPSKKVLAVCQGILLRWEDGTAYRQERLSFRFSYGAIWEFLEKHPPVARTFWLG